jgi:hypothetical protein
MKYTLVLLIAADCAFSRHCLLLQNSGAVLRRAQSQRSLDPSVDASVLARFFVSVAQSLNVMHKTEANPAVLKDGGVRVAMSVWPVDKQKGKGRPCFGGEDRPDLQDNLAAAHLICG